LSAYHLSARPKSLAGMVESGRRPWSTLSASGRTNVERYQVGRNHDSQRTTSTSNTQALTTATTNENATPGTSQ
jgi:hypothetical protein